MAWKPGRLARNRELESPYEDVPDHLFVPLWSWISFCLFDQYGGILSHAHVALDLRMVLPVRAHEASSELSRRFQADRELMLDVVEAILAKSGFQAQRVEPNLAALLAQANSAYAVSADWRNLELRVDPQVKAQVQSVVREATGSAGDHLAAAWNTAYGRNPDTSKSYSESIKAVEAALASHVTPQNAKQTLGTMITDIRNKPEKWEYPFRSADTFSSMLRTLWEGQSSRHGGTQPTRIETREEAVAAVHMAATLVQFGVSGAFHLA